MDPSRWRQIKEVFAAAEKLSIGERSSFIHQAYPKDPELRLEVERLLGWRDQADCFLAQFADDISEQMRPQAERTAVAWQLVEDLFAKGLHAAEDRRDALLSDLSIETAAILRVLWATVAQTGGPAQAPALSSGDRIGPYEVVSQLGCGGMGEVYLARDHGLNRDVAIKVLPVAFAADTERVRRLHREGQAASALKHPNIVTVHELGETQGRTFLVTEFIEGQTLKDKLADGGVSVDQALEVAIEIARGLQAAHEQGVVHRDIKPANIMLLPDGRVKIVDFGLALCGDDRTLTGIGSVMGSPPYMSPEQRHGESVDARTDIWSLGVVIFEMIVGRLPVSQAAAVAVADSFTTSSHHRLSALWSGAPEKLHAILNKCMATDRRDRYQCTTGLLSDLQQLRGLHGTARIRLRASIKRVWPVFVMGVAVVLFCGLSIWYSRASQSHQRQHPKAYELFLKGQYARNEPGEAGLRDAIVNFKEAILYDPDFSLAHVGIADAWFWLSSWYLRPHDAMPNAKAAALRALEVEPELADAHSALGNVALFYDWNWSAAERHFRRAIELNPNSAAAHRGYSDYMLAQRRFDEAIEQGRIAIELDPFSLTMRAGYLLALVTASRNDEAITEAQRALDVEPAFSLALVVRGLARSAKKLHIQAMRDLEEAVEIERTPTNLGFLAYVQAAAGHRQRAFPVLQELRRTAGKRYVCPLEVAMAYSAFGDTDEAFRWMEKAIAERADCMAMLAAEPWLEGIRRDPRFPGLLHRVGLKDAAERR